MVCNVPETGYGGARQQDVTMFPTRHLAAVIALTASMPTTHLAAVPAEGQPQPIAASITCTNPSSGATWQISIDYDRATVDANPARVTDTEVSWRDPKDGWNYKLDRRSGALTVVVASSTGGYFLHDHCRLPP
jgi:hypothetical protein